MNITEEQYEEAANLLGCKMSAIKAVAEVESLGDGFLKSGKLKILFEGHHFYKNIKSIEQAAFAKSFPTIYYPKWTSKFYLGGEAEYSRFNQAFRIAPVAALLSTSWGAFQIMGFNYDAAGYYSVGEMVDDYKKGEYNQLVSFCKFVKAQGLDKFLQGEQPNFGAFAFGYNGKSFAENKYDIKLKKAFEKWEQYYSEKAV